MRQSPASRRPTSSPAAFVLTWLGLWTFICAFPARAIPQQATAAPDAQSAPPMSPEKSASTSPQSVGALTGNIEGTVTDQNGGGIDGAQVTLILTGQALARQASCDTNGHFSFSRVASGHFQLTITEPGFTSQSVSGILHPGETYTALHIVLRLPPVVTQVKVTPPRAEMAKYQLEIEEKQRVFGVFPNFYVSYFQDPVPLSSRQKFRLAAKTILDPVNIGVTAAVAGVEHGLDSYSGFPPGAEGYAQRFGAAYADNVVGTMLGNAILPSLLKQDPRYFYKGTGSWQSRLAYAVSRAFICKGDNGRWQPAYSSFIGSVAAGSISNLYYPVQNRNGITLTVENALIGIGSDAIINIIQEFIIPKLAPPLALSQPTGH